MEGFSKIDQENLVLRKEGNNARPFYPLGNHNVNVFAGKCPWQLHRVGTCKDQLRELGMMDDSFNEWSILSIYYRLQRLTAHSMELGRSILVTL